MWLGRIWENKATFFWRSAWGWYTACANHRHIWHPAQCIPHASHCRATLHGKQLGRTKERAGAWHPRLTTLSSHWRKNQDPTSWIHNWASKVCSKKGGNRIFITCSMNISVVKVWDTHNPLCNKKGLTGSLVMSEKRTTFSDISFMPVPSFLPSAISLPE